MSQDTPDRRTVGAEVKAGVKVGAKGGQRMGKKQKGKKVKRGKSVWVFS